MKTSGERTFWLSVLAVLALIMVLHFAAGLGAVVVVGRSMWPLLRTGDVVVVEAASRVNITVGDIVVYRFSGDFYGQYIQDELIIHKVIYIYYHNGTECVVTKGINNPVPDPGYPQVCGYVKLNGTYVSGVPVSDVEWVAAGGPRPVVIPYVGYIVIALRGMPPSS